MAGDYNSGSTTAVITGSVTATITQIALSAVSGNNGGLGSSTIATVPALKKWRIYGATLCSNYTSPASTATITLTANGVTILASTCANFTGGVVDSVSLNLGTNYYEIQAGQTIVLNGTLAGSRSHAVVFYQELDA